MPTTPTLPELTQFIRAVQQDTPLDVSLAEDLSKYVPHLQGARDALGLLKAEITHREGDGVYLFTGQVGSGKSTELLRLKRDLASPQCKVYYCDMQNWLNVNAPIDLASMLLALVAAWLEQIGSVAGQRSPIERLVEFLSATKLELGEIKLGLGLDVVKADLKVALQTDPKFRARLAQVVQDNVGSFVSQAHRFVASLVADICPNGEKCVLIADSLEKIRGYGTDATKVYESIQQLFLSEGAALRLPQVHVVYSVSPFLLDQNPQLATILGQGVVVNMPSVHVFERRSNQLDADGVKQMTTLVANRFAGWAQFIAPDLLEKLVRDSGGDLRDYLRAIKVVLLERESNPDARQEELLDLVRGQISPPRQVPSAHLAWMAKLERSHEAELDDQVNATVFNGYLQTKHVLAYLNGTTWYAIHPLLRDWVLARPEAQLKFAAAPGDAVA